MNTRLPGETNTDYTLDQVVNDWLPRMQGSGISPALVLDLISKITEWPNWCHVWSCEAKAQEKRGVEAEQRGHMVTAGEAYLSASLLYHYAQFMFFVDLKQKHDAAEHKVTLYQSAAPFLQPPSLHIEIPYKTGSLKGYLRGFGPKRSNVVVIIAGINSSKEEFSALEKLLLNRGLATLSIDGPGQGEGREIGPLTPDWDPLIQVIVNTLREDRSCGRIGLLGMAFGGHLVLRTAHIPAIDAVVAIDCFFDLSRLWDTLPNIYHSNMRYILKTNSPEETARRAKAFTLKAVPPPNCPTLVVQGLRDNMFSDQNAEEFSPWSQGKVDLQIQKLGSHSSTNITHTYLPMVADWLADRLLLPH